jgi:hypothetical protein
VPASNTRVERDVRVVNTTNGAEERGGASPMQTAGCQESPWEPGQATLSCTCCLSMPSEPCILFHAGIFTTLGKVRDKKTCQKENKVRSRCHVLERVSKA